MGRYSADIHDQKQLEAELERQVNLRTSQLQTSVADLQRSNENLQQFAYVASHDLQEPLLKIQRFSNRLLNRYANSTGEELAYVERIQSAAERMSALIKDVLRYSLLSDQPDVHSSVSLTKIVQQVLSSLEPTIEKTGAQVRVEALPTVLGNASQLNQLFQNLLSNALKFHRPDGSDAGEPPLIEVRSTLVPSEQLPEPISPSRSAPFYHQIEVVDNGIGFEEKYLDRIFQVFQRLHSKNQYEGTGIGLAICAKVAASHGGGITARSQLDQGTTFTIYLPA